MPAKCPWGKEIESVSGCQNVIAGKEPNVLGEVSKTFLGEGATHLGELSGWPSGRRITSSEKSNLPPQILPFSQPNPDVTTVSLTRNAQLT
jgi:hypothetical protein